MNFKKSTTAGFLTLGLLCAVSFAQAETRPTQDGAVFTATNDPNDNQIVIFTRDKAGSLSLLETIATGGKGSGGQLDPLGSNSSLKLTSNRKWLLAVNAGSNEISVFRVTRGGIEFRSKVDSQGTMPVSIAVHRHLVYVLNAAGAPNVAGFKLNSRGVLSPIKDSVRVFDSVTAGGPAQVGFDTRGKNLIITDKKDNSVLAYSISDWGVLSDKPITTASDGVAPFGFVSDSAGRTLVVNAGSGTVASYEDHGRDGLVAVASSETSGQTAACWIGRTQDGLIYTTNPGSSTLSSFSEDLSTGVITLVNAVAANAKAPLDMAIVGDQFIYTVDPAAGGIDIFQIAQDGRLSSLGTVTSNLAIYAQGLAAY